jgi:hypothetical protein
MPIWICRQLSLRQFQNRLGIVLEAECHLDLPKDSDAIIEHLNSDVRRPPSYHHRQRGARGVVDGVIDHFGYAVLPNVDVVPGKPFEQRQDGFVPHSILFQSGLNREAEPNFILL